MFQYFFKPKWQNKNPDIRIKAISQLQGNDKIVIQLALADEEDAVRKASIYHLTHLPTLLNIIQAKNRESNLALERLNEQLVHSSADEPGLGDALCFLDNEKICQSIILGNKQSIETRTKLVEKINNIKLLRQIKNTNKLNKKIQHAVRNRIQLLQEKQHKQAELQDICNKMALLKKEKNPNIIKDQLYILKQKYSENSDSVTPEIMQQYQQIYLEIKKLIQDLENQEAKFAPSRKAKKGVIQSQKILLDQLNSHPFSYTKASLEEALNLLQQAWNEIPVLEDVEASQLERDFNEQQAQLRALQHKLNQNLITAEKLQKLLSQAKNLSQQSESVGQQTLLKLTTAWKKNVKSSQFQILDAEFQGYVKHLTQKIKQQENQKEHKIKLILEHLEQLEKALTDEQLELAFNAFQQAQKILKNTPDIEPALFTQIKQRIAIAQPQIKAMKEWRHWGTDQARQNLIKEAQILVDDDSLSITQRSKKISQCRKQWKKLDHMDGVASAELWHTFDTLCNAAYEPCEAYYKTQTEVRQNNLKKREQYCETLEQLYETTDWDNPKWRDLDKQIKQITRHWRTAGSVDRKIWKNINTRFNQACQQLEIYLGEERQRNWLQREALLQQALDLNEITDLEEAKAQAIQLRCQWKTTVTEHTQKEQRLWKKFQGALDAVDKRIEDKKQASKQALEENLRQKQSICEKIIELSQDPHFLDKQAELIELENAFHHIPPVANFNRKKIKSQFETCLKKAQSQTQLLQKQREVEQLRQLQTKAQYCQAVELQTEDIKVIQKQWQALPALLDNKLEQQMQKRFEKATIAPPEVQQTKEQLCLDLEILLKIDSPEQYKKARMQRQVELLDQQMRQGDNIELATKVKQKIVQWFALSTLEKEQQDKLDSRFTFIFDVLIT